MLRFYKARKGRRKEEHIISLLSVLSLSTAKSVLT